MPSGYIQTGFRPVPQGHPLFTPRLLLMWHPWLVWHPSPAGLAPGHSLLRCSVKRDSLTNKVLQKHASLAPWASPLHSNLTSSYFILESSVHEVRGVVCPMSCCSVHTVVKAWCSNQFKGIIEIVSCRSRNMYLLQVGVAKCAKCKNDRSKSTPWQRSSVAIWVPSKTEMKNVTVKLNQNFLQRLKRLTLKPHL